MFIIENLTKKEQEHIVFLKSFSEKKLKNSIIILENYINKNSIFLIDDVLELKKRKAVLKDKISNKIKNF